MNERLFDGKAALYARFRPGYPPALPDWLRASGLAAPHMIAADIGAGTGIFSRLLAPLVKTVLAVEPNEDMRREGEAQGGGNLRFLAGSAEATGLPDASLDLVTAAQAFHWFDRAAFRRECRRILRPGGQVLLVWNHQDADSPLMQELAALNRRFCPRFQGFSAGRNHPADLAECFRFQTASFPNETLCGAEAFAGRCLSSSYAPRPEEDAYPAYRQALAALFRKYSRDGTVRYPYVTQCYYGSAEDGDAVFPAPQD